MQLDYVFSLLMLIGITLHKETLGQEGALEEGTTTHSSILAWRIPWTEEPGGLQSMGLQRVRHDFHLGRGIEGLVMLFCMRVCAVRVRDGGQEKDWGSGYLVEGVHWGSLVKQVIFFLG